VSGGKARSFERVVELLKDAGRTHKGRGANVPGRRPQARHGQRKILASSGCAHANRWPSSSNSRPVAEAPERQRLSGVPFWWEGEKR
jgi:hypothetical protein